MLQVATKEYDLGTIKFGTISESKILVSNLADTEAFINTIGSSCSCTTGYMDKNPIPVHGSANAIIAFNSNKVGRGQHVKSFTISSTIKGKLHSQTVRFRVNVV